MNTPRRLQLCLLTLLSAIAILGAGCKEQEVPFVVDEDEIERAVLESSQGRELFRTAGLVIPEPYVYATATDTFTLIDTIVSQGRVITVEASDAAADYGSLGMAREAIAVVQDTFVLKTTKIKHGVSTQFTRKSRYTRYGFFLKLGDDAEPYVGWVLWGFRGIAPALAPDIDLWGPDNQQFQGGEALYTNHLKLMYDTYLYVRLTDLKQLAKGVPVRLRGDLPWDYMMTYETTNGQYTNVEGMGAPAIDTVSTPAATTRLYNLIVLQEYQWPVTRGAAFIPYRLQ